MPRYKKTPFQEWETKNKNGEEKRYFRMGVSIMATSIMRSLSPSAFKIYCYMRLESGGKKSFKFPFSKYRSYTTRPTFEKALQELVDKGFIDVVQRNSNLRKANIYSFSTRWKDL